MNESKHIMSAGSVEDFIDDSLDKPGDVPVTNPTLGNNRVMIHNN